MKKISITVTVLALIVTASSMILMSEGSPGVSATKRILILVDGDYDINNFATAEGRMIATLLGHFNVTTSIKGTDRYAARELERYDFTFFIGRKVANIVPAQFARDVLNSKKTIVWLNTGMTEFSETYHGDRRYGFSVRGIERKILYDSVTTGEKKFTRQETYINSIDIVDGKKAVVLATAHSSETMESTPYIVRSGNLYYFADAPVTIAGETDRYLLFADMLHDILKEPHGESRNAIIRIEDVSASSDPARLRSIADILSKRGIPFLVAAIPIYVNPHDKIRIPLSEAPDVAAALRYMVRRGGTIVMHGVTHQYRGETADDYEFWDGNSNNVIKGEKADEIAEKIETGIREFMKCGLCPLLWETPHYSASFLTYRIVSRYFSTAVEQKLASMHYDYGQYYPYVIKKDLFGQKIFPENIGYVPLNPELKTMEASVKNLVGIAKYDLNVRDGYATCFFHPFLDLSLLEKLVDGIRGLGFTYVDVRRSKNWVNGRDRVILSGSQSYSINLKDSYLKETIFNAEGEPVKITVSMKKMNGKVRRKIALEPGEVYVAEPVNTRSQ